MQRIDWKWEQIDHYSPDNISGSTTARAKVIGGWLLRTASWNRMDKCQSESMVFVEDRGHKWKPMPPVIETIPPEEPPVSEGY